MGRQQEKTRNRANNAGGVPLDAYKTSLSIANALNELRPKTRGVAPSETTHLNIFHLYFLYMWITQQLTALDDIASIPDLTIVSGSANCAPHSLRRIRESGISWVEYALAYPSKTTEKYVWQPLPEALNALFSDWLTHHNNSLRLSPDEKTQLFNQLKQRKWRTPEALRNRHMLRKDTMYNYVGHQATVDPYLSTPAKSLLTRALHHRSALSYQTLNSNQIRYEIFSAHNRYLARLSQAIGSTDIHRFCHFCLPGSKAIRPLFSSVEALPPYLQTRGEIVAFQLQVSQGARTYVPMPSIAFGSTRAIEMTALKTFFAFLRRQLCTPPVLQHCPEKNNAALREYFNQRTFELALLFVLLTGARPTHHISIECTHCFGLQRAFIKDKGRYRQIELCEYLKNAIQDYQQLRQQVFKVLNIDAHPMQTLWYLLTDTQGTEYLSAKSLRDFMTKNWAACFDSDNRASKHSLAVPYQLRHSFAQHAIISSHPKLSAQLIDVLMGHSEAGEQLGQSYLFSDCHQILCEHLTRWPELLALNPFATPTLAEERLYDR